MAIVRLRASSRLFARLLVRPASTETSSHGGRKPMINFNSKSRTHGLEAGKPHAGAPPDIVKNFASFGKRPVVSSSSSSSSLTSKSPPPKPSSSSSASSSNLPKADYEDIFDLPERYSRRPPIEEDELEAIMTGGASLRDPKPKPAKTTSA